MRQLKNQAGLTLIEVLATLTILSIVSVVIYNVFSNGLRYSSQAEDTVLIQQEANYLLTLLKEQHENSDFYTVTIDKEGQTFIINEGLTNEINVTNTNYYYYQICEMDETGPKVCSEKGVSSFVKTIHPKVTNNQVNGDIYGNFYLKINLTSKTNPNLTYEIKTILSRL